MISPTENPKNLKIFQQSQLEHVKENLTLFCFNTGNSIFRNCCCQLWRTRCSDVVKEHTKGSCQEISCSWGGNVFQSICDVPISVSLFLHHFVIWRTVKTWFWTVVEYEERKKLVIACGSVIQETNSVLTVTPKFNLDASYS